MVRRGIARPTNELKPTAMAAIGPEEAAAESAHSEAAKPAPSLGSYQESPYYAPERGGNHPAPRVLGQAYVTQEQREARKREVLGGQGSEKSANTGAAGATSAAAGGSAHADYSSQELHEKTVIESAYAAGVKKLAEERGLGVEHQTLGGAGAGTSGSARKEPIVEVIGIEDREKAEKVALKATRDLEKKGQDVLNSKIVVDANKREIYIEQGAGDAQRTQDAERAQRQAELAGAPGALGVAAAGGAVGAGAGALGSRSTHPDAAFDEKNPRDVDPRLFHSQHQEVKRELEQDAQEGRLGEVKPTGSAGGSGVNAGSAAVVGAAGAAGVFAASRGGHSHQTPDAAFNEENPRDVDPRQFHSQHEHVKDELEEYVQEGRLGAIEPESSALGAGAGATGSRDAGPTGGSSGSKQTAGSSGAALGAPDSAFASGAALGAPAAAFQQPSTGTAISSLGSRGATHGAPDAAFDEPNPREVDPTKFHSQHEKVKDELEEYAEEGRLGDVKPQSGSFGYGTAAAAGVAGATAGVAGLGLASQGKSHEQPDATFHLLNPGDVDPRKYHSQHEEVKRELEDQAEEGTLGNVSATNDRSGYREPYPSTSTGSSGAPDPSHYQNVKVIGVKDKERAGDLARQAVAAIQGRPEILENTKELRVDASGAVTDEQGAFLLQLGRGLISEDTQARGGLVTPPVAGSRQSKALASEWPSQTAQPSSNLSNQPNTSSLGSGAYGSAGSAAAGLAFGSLRTPGANTAFGTQESDPFGSGASLRAGTAGHDASTTAAPGAGASSESADAAPDQQALVAMPGALNF